MVCTKRMMELIITMIPAAKNVPKKNNALSKLQTLVAAAEALEKSRLLVELNAFSNNSNKLFV